MKIIRAFQVINQDGGYTVACTYNEVDDEGNVKKRNAKISFYAVDSEVKEHIEALETYLNNRIEEESK